MELTEVSFCFAATETVVFVVLRPAALVLHVPPGQDDGRFCRSRLRQRRVLAPRLRDGRDHRGGDGSAVPGVADCAGRLGDPVRDRDRVLAGHFADRAAVAAALPRRRRRRLRREQDAIVRRHAGVLQRVRPRGRRAQVHTVGPNDIVRRYTT